MKPSEAGSLRKGGATKRGRVRIYTDSRLREVCNAAADGEIPSRAYPRRDSRQLKSAPCPGWGRPLCRAQGALFSEDPLVPIRSLTILQKQYTPEDIKQLRIQLAEDAECAAALNDTEYRKEWIEPQRWSQYMGASGRRLYNSFTDDELLDILRSSASELGRPPTQKEVFCVYRSYIRRRFVNWPTALRAAGLKAPKKRGTHHEGNK